ncbi:MAG: hypothetical protein ACFE8N_11575 [Promethearchaeota archaeon]
MDRFNGCTVSIYMGSFGPEPRFLFDVPEVLIPGAISFMLILISAIILFISSLTHRQKEIPNS